MMDADLYRNLVESDCKECWPLVRNVIGRQLLGEDVMMVPYLEDAKRYHLGSVILREKLSTAEKIQQRLPGAIQVGHLNDFVTQELMPAVRERAENCVDIGDHSINQRYYFEEADQKRTDKKFIRVELDGCKKHAQIHPPPECSLIVDMRSKGFENLDKFYYIHEVYYISGLQMKVIINEKVDSIFIDQQIPIAFRLKRYKIHPDGMIGNVKDISNKKWHVIWVKGCKFRNPLSALPFLPVEDIVLDEFDDEDDDDDTSERLV